MVRDKIAKYQIEDTMKALVKKHMGLKPYQTLDCKVMDLYKAGTITWDEAKEAIHKDCDL